jgi:hypothetical protein
MSLLGAEEIEAGLWRRRDAINELASHRRASSIKGALFQICLAADAMLTLAGDPPRHKRTSGELRSVTTPADTSARLHYSAISLLEDVVGDGELDEVRRIVLAPSFDVLDHCDRMVAGRRGLDVLAAPKRES